MAVGMAETCYPVAPLFETGVAAAAQFSFSVQASGCAQQ
jgi:hypothetical protein